jgi:hypothetical protein
MATRAPPEGTEALAASILAAAAASHAPPHVVFALEYGTSRYGPCNQLHTRSDTKPPAVQPADDSQCGPCNQADDAAYGVWR